MPDDARDRRAELDRTARAWVARLAGRTPSAAEAEDLAAWRARSPAHDAAYGRAVALRALVNEAAAGFETGPAPRITRRGLVLGAAAGGALTLGGAQAASILGVLPTWRGALADFRTGRGEHQRLELGPGLTVELDGQSALDVAATPPGTLWLIEGAAHVTVAETSPNAVTLSAGPWEMTADQGEFAVRHGPAGIDIACLTGWVRARGPGQVTIGPGKHQALRPTGPGPARLVDADEISPWRRGFLVFEDRALSDVVADINRHRPGRIVIWEPNLSARRVSGVFRLSEVDAVLDRIAA
ncbi:MAG: DUF4880 domain-containing protein, partial [Pseudomonadota bacterium]